ncbi:MAG TPA: MFS transporter [Opitutaceae bacterium]|nr:MFS transporter [Opitutaceae bacterium]
MSLGSAQERLPGKTLAAYGVGIIAYQFVHSGVGTLAMQIFNIELGYAPALVGAILMAGRIWDSLSNPLVGAISDNTRTRWGRRRPFLMVGAVVSGLLYPLIWFVPRDWGTTAAGTYLILSTFLLYTGFALYSVPYIAMGFEMTPDPHERTRIQIWRTYFNLVTTFAIGWFYWFCQRPFFGDAVTGARWLSLIVGVGIILTGMAPAFFLRERYYRVAEQAKREPLWRGVRDAVRNRPFLLLLGVILAVVFGAMSADALSFYILAYHVYGGDTLSAAKLAGIAASVNIAASLLAVRFVSKLEMRLGKIHALRACLGVMILAAISKWFFASPEYPAAWLLIGVISQFGVIGFWILVNSMKADVCDWDELNSAQRREGAYGAVGNLVQKGGFSLVYVLAGTILHLVGFDATQRGSQSPETILSLRLAFTLVPIAFLLPCVWLLRHYPLTREKMQEIRATLEARRSRV